MTKWHAVMMGEDGREFGVSFVAGERESAREYLEEHYPESMIEQLESPEDTARREEELYAELFHDDGVIYGKWQIDNDWDEYNEHDYL